MSITKNDNDNHVSGLCFSFILYLYIHIRIKQLQQTQKMTTSENTIWQELTKCPFDISLVVTNLAKQFLGYVDG